MKLVVQKVNFAKVSINNNIHNSISQGLLVYIGFSNQCKEETITSMAQKLLNLKIFPNSEGKNFKKAIEDVQGEILLISQFTLFGDCSKKNNPQFNKSAPFEIANKYYEMFIRTLSNKTTVPIKTGIFGEHMIIESSNDGPITLLLEK